MMGPKSSNFVKVNYPNSMDTLLSLLEVLKDPKKFESQIQALKDYMDQANKTIETLGKAEKIDSLLADAQVKQSQAQAASDEIQAKIDQMLNKANETAHKLVSDAQIKANDLLNIAKEKSDRATQDAKQSSDDKQKYTSLLNSVNQQKADLDKRENEIKSIEAEIARKKAILSQLSV